LRVPDEVPEVSHSFLITANLSPGMIFDMIIITGINETRTQIWGVFDGDC
jgi:hypothetical protein